MKKIIKNIKQLVQVEETARTWVAGKDMASLNCIDDAYLIVNGDLIEDFGKMADLDSDIDDDIVEELNNLMSFVKESNPANKKVETSDLNEELSQLIDFIGFEPTSLDLLLERTGLSTHKISSQLLQLELKGHIIRIHGGYMRK